MSETSSKTRCADCEKHPGQFFCEMLRGAPAHSDASRAAEEHPRGAVLLNEGQTPRGVYVLCARRVKLTTSSGDARVLITDICGPGDVLGLARSSPAPPTRFRP